MQPKKSEPLHYLKFQFSPPHPISGLQMSPKKSPSLYHKAPTLDFPFENQQTERHVDRRTPYQLYHLRLNRNVLGLYHNENSKDEISNKMGSSEFNQQKNMSKTATNKKGKQSCEGQCHAWCPQWYVFMNFCPVQGKLR